MRKPAERRSRGRAAACSGSDGMAWNHPSRRRARWLGFALGCLGLGDGLRALAQETPVNAAPPAASVAVPGGGTGREAQLEERIRQLESVIQRMPDPEQVRRLEAKLQEMPDAHYVRQLEATVQQLSTQVRQLSTRLEASQGSRAMTPSSPTGGAAGGGTLNAGVGEEPVGGAAGISPSAPPPTPRFDMPEPIPDLPLRSRFGPGFELKTVDDEFNIQLYDLTQADGRFYGRGNQTPVSDTFGLARQWLIFSGHLTRPCEYYISLADAIDTFNILDVFLNVNYDRRFQFRIGRFKTPFAYEFYAAPVQALPNGEWSLFFNNFGMNRDVGTMVWGELFQYRLDYAVGLFNSVPNGFVDLSNPKDGIAYLNFAPWETV